MPNELTREEWHIIAVLTSCASKEIPPDHEVSKALNLTSAFARCVVDKFALQEENKP